MIKEILTLILWPVYIYVSYKLCVWALKKYDAKQEVRNTEGN